MFKVLCGCCNAKRDAHARFFLVLLAFVCTFVGTVVAGGAPFNGSKTYIDAVKNSGIFNGHPMGGGFGSAIVATILQFFAVVLSLIADCCTKETPKAETTAASAV